MSEDLIRRSDAIKAVAEYISCDYATEEMATESATLLIDTIPTIEPKRGRWIPVDNGHHVRCSECGRCGFASNNFCSNCGADMRGEDNE